MPHSHRFESHINYTGEMQMTHSQRTDVNIQWQHTALEEPGLALSRSLFPKLYESPRGRVSVVAEVEVERRSGEENAVTSALVRRVRCPQCRIPECIPIMIVVDDVPFLRIVGRNNRDAISRLLVDGQILARRNTLDGHLVVSIPLTDLPLYRSLSNNSCRTQVRGRETYLLIALAVDLEANDRSVVSSGEIESSFALHIDDLVGTGVHHI